MMKRILWLCNNPTPQACGAFGWNTIAVGGWIVWLSEQIAKDANFQLSLAFTSKKVDERSELMSNGVTYYAVPDSSVNTWTYNEKFEKHFKTILGRVNPDIVHIWGTEYQHSLAMVRACDSLDMLDKCIISIQGLVSVYAKYYLGNLDENEKKVITLRDIMKNDLMTTQKKHFEMRGVFEREALQKVKHVIGRTDWDLALSKQINPNIVYHFNNENLRDSFYNAQWMYNNCQKHSIFISQAQYPIKGLDVVLKILPEILKSFHDTKVYVAGAQVIYGSKYKKTSYEKILVKLIEKYQLEDVVSFVGMLNEEQMVQEYLKANVFVCPSVIENSPNSVGEAMILGTPVIATYVGGTNCLLTHKVDGYLYQSNAEYMLAYYIKSIFSNEEKTIEFSKAARKHALKTHDRDINYAVLMDIYDEVMGK